MKWLAGVVGIALAIGPAAVAEQQAPDPYRDIAERYVRLVLAVGQHDGDYVDAYYGPPDWRTQAETQKIALPEIDTAAAALETDLAKRAAPTWKEDAELWRLHKHYLERQIGALRTKVAMLQGKRLTFDEESQALYDAVAPHHTEKEFSTIIAKLETRLPGDGPLIKRYEAFKNEFVIPRDRLGPVFDAAIRACRDRTRQYIDLPAGESFTVEYVTGKSWGGYNWYQGRYRSLIQVNTDLPVYIERAIDLACHEGYPGHHVYNALLEKTLVRDRGWIEFTVYPLFSPQSLIAEGTANYGIDVAFTKDARIQFERDVLFPLAGLGTARVKDYYDVLDLVDQLTYAGNEAARRYLDGEIDARGAADWLEKFAMMPLPRAEQRIKFFDQYRSYVINYNLGKDLVRTYIERRTKNDTAPRRRWAEFASLLSSPRLPSGLK
jgi:hypothetical protein